MKLSDIHGERTLDVIADIIEPIANIAGDKMVAELFEKRSIPDGMNVKEFLILRAKKAVPALIKGHKADLMAVMASIEGVGVAEYAKSLNLVKLLKDCIDLVSDDTFMTLFISAQSETSSGFAPENTGEA